jgi:hypothetical protein
VQSEPAEIRRGRCELGVFHDQKLAQVIEQDAGSALLDSEVERVGTGDHVHVAEDLALLVQQKTPRSAAGVDRLDVTRQESIQPIAPIRPGQDQGKERPLDEQNALTCGGAGSGHSRFPPLSPNAASGAVKLDSPEVRVAHGLLRRS